MLWGHFWGLTNHMRTSFIKLLSSCMLLGVCSGCLKTRYYIPQYLKPLTTESAEYKKTVDNATILIKKLTYKESAHLFENRINCFYPDGPSSKNPPQGIYPVQIAIHNASNYAWILDASAISLPLVTKHELINILHQNQQAMDNEAIDFDITRKIMPYTSTVNPDETLSALIFIKAADWDPYFTIRLERSDNAQDLVFHIHTKDTL